jgi:hypothetical protein
LHYRTAEKFVNENYSSLLGPFISYKQNEVLKIQLWGWHSQKFLF